MTTEFARCPKCGDDILVGHSAGKAVLAHHAFAPGLLCDGSGLPVTADDEDRA